MLRSEWTKCRGVARWWLAAFLALLAARAAAQADIPGNAIRIGVLTDMSGANADRTGHGSVVAARLAVEDAVAFLPGVLALGGCPLAQSVR